MYNNRFIPIMTISGYQNEKNIAILAYMSVKDIKIDCISFQVILSS